MSNAAQEKAKYEKAWDLDSYRNKCHGENVVMNYVMKCRPKSLCSVIDFGTGTGRGAFALHRLGFNLSMIDIAENCLDEEVREELGDRLIVGSLWDKLDMPRADEGFCTDVMEHLPPEHVDEAIENIMGLCDRAFFKICFVDDIGFSKALEESLHLTIKPYTWWRDKLGEYGKVTDARDLLIDGWFYVQN